MDFREGLHIKPSNGIGAPESSIEDGARERSVAASQIKMGTRFALVPISVEIKGRREAKVLLALPVWMTS